MAEGLGVKNQRTRDDTLQLEAVPVDIDDLEKLADMVQVFSMILDIPTHTIVIGSESGALITRTRLDRREWASLIQKLAED